MALDSAVIHLQAEITETSTALGDSSTIYLQAEITETSTALGDSAVLFIEDETTNPLIRNDQISFRTIGVERLVNIPVNVLGSINNFDLTQTGEQVLYQNTTGLPGFVLGVFVQITAVETLTVVPEIGVGVASATNDILASEPLTGVSAVADTWSNWVVLSKARNAIPNDTVKINVTGATADKLLANIYLIGFEY